MVNMDPSAHFRSGWTVNVFYKGQLTDKKIARYQRLGYYSAEFRAARKEYQDNKRKRKGNFVQGEGGRLIYSPL